MNGTESDHSIFSLFASAYNLHSFIQLCDFNLTHYPLFSSCHSPPLHVPNKNKSLGGLFKADMSRNDQVIDDDEPDTCPLCIEELDLSDRNFRPCPCGYQVRRKSETRTSGHSDICQVCQFCYNNIKTTMNGLCPACRRQYDDKNIKFDAPTAEEYGMPSRHIISSSAETDTL